MDGRAPHRLVRHHADDLRAGDHDAALARLLARCIEHRVRGAHLVVREVHADLGSVVVLDHPADRLHVTEAPVGEHGTRRVLRVDTQILVALAQVAAVYLEVVLGQLLERVGHVVAGPAGIRAVVREFDHLALVVEGLRLPGPLPAAPLAQHVSDLVRVAPVRRVQVDVVSDEELAGADRCGPGRRIELRRPEVRPPVRLLQLLRQPLVFARPHPGQVAALRPRRRPLVQVDRDPQLLADPPAHPTGQLDALLHRHARDRHERADVRGAEARVRALVLPHVDHLGGTPDGAERGFGDRVRRPDERHDRTVGVPSRIDVQGADPGDTGDRVGDLFDGRVITALGEIRYALDDLLHADPLAVSAD